ncbi:MAG: hypothetical protein FWD34_04760 [Oscillospiraceae bacterium]|nr:hypothetical protein [Oscillospiraceae bacterium]
MGTNGYTIYFDDSRQSFSQGREKNEFYITPDNAIVFVMHWKGSSIIWIDMDNPDTMHLMYINYFNDGVSDGLWVLNSSSYLNYNWWKKTDLPINQPEEGYMNGFKLIEISWEYSIERELLFVIEHDGLYYNESYYSMYMVSQAPNKFVFKTTLTNEGIGVEIPPDFVAITLDVIITFEKIDGEWVRKVEKA